MACTNPRQTGRTRTLTFRGDTLCQGRLKWVCDFPITHETVHTYGYLYIQCMGFEIEVLTNVDPARSPTFCFNDFGVPPPMTKRTSLTVSYLGAVVYSNTTALSFFAADGVEYTADGSGSWEISFDVEEWEEILTPDLATDIDGTYFPNCGGTAQQDGSPARRRVLYEVPTSDLSISVVAGPESYSATHTSTGDPVSYVVFAVAGAESIQSGNVETASTTIEFQGDNLGCSYTYSDAYGEVDCTNGVLATSLDRTTPGATFVYGVISIAPPIEVAFDGIVRAPGDDFPSTVPATFIAGTLSTSVDLAPTGTATLEMRQFEAYAITNGLSRTGLSALEQGLIYAYLTSAGLLALNDDTRDRRLQARGLAWYVGTIAHEEYMDIDDGSSYTDWADGANTTGSSDGTKLTFVVSGGTGDAVRTFSPRTDCEGYDKIRVRIRSTVNDNQPFTLQFTNTLSTEDKEYSGVTDTAGTWIEVDLDLLVPDGSTADHDEQESRYPLTDVSEVPNDSGPYWGLNVIETMTLKNLADGETYEVEYIRRQRDGDTTPRFSVLPSFLPWLLAWTSGTDNTYHHPFTWIESGGRISDHCALFRVVPFVGSPSLTYYTIDQVFTDLESITGVTIVRETTFTDDCYTLDNYGLFLWGGGHLYLSGSWSHAFDVDVTSAVDLYAQDLWDEYQVYPGCGDPETGIYTPGEATPYRVAKTLRGQGWGVLFDDTYARKNLASAELLDWPTMGASVSAGLGNSDVKGRFQTGTPWGKGNRRHKLYATDKPTISREINPLANRMRHRGVFLSTTEGRPLAYTVASNWIHARIAVVAGDPKIQFSANLQPLVWDIEQTITEPDWASLVWSADRAKLYYAYSLAGTAQVDSTSDQGATWDAFISSFAADTVSITRGWSGEIILLYGNGGTLTSKRYDSLGTQLQSLTADTGIDTYAISVCESSNRTVYGVWAKSGSVTLNSLGALGWSLEATLGSGTHAAIVASSSNDLFIYWIDGTAIKGVIYDSGLNTIKTTFTAVASGVEDGPLVVQESRMSLGRWRLVLMYTSAGVISEVYSTNGFTFA